MPNTEVKLQHAKSSWGIAPCKDRTLPRDYSGIAQLVEHLTVNQVVDGSSPPAGALDGELSEWLKEQHWKCCKRVLTCFEGSNPSLSVSQSMTRWSSGLRHCPFTAVTWVRIPYGSLLSWRISSVGRASALQAEGHRFEPCILHKIIA